jgi:hypothetical protein
MHIRRFLASSPISALALGFGALLVLSACSINVKKNEAGEDKNVDIQTPIGGIHVSQEADARDTGLEVYPGAQAKQKDSSGDNKKANVNISGFGFGVKVVALEYVSNDPPQKLVTFYKDQLKKYGDVLECHTSEHSGHVGTDLGDKKGDSALHCDGDSGGKTIELKVGTKENQHVVAIEPDGTGSTFALVYVRTHGKDDTI